MTAMYAWHEITAGSGPGTQNSSSACRLTTRQPR